MELMKEQQSEVTKLSTEEKISEEREEDSQRRGRGEEGLSRRQRKCFKESPTSTHVKKKKSAETHAEAGPERTSQTAAGQVDNTGDQTDGTGEAPAEVRQVCSAPPALRCSSRLAAKPRRVHRVKGRVDPDPAEPPERSPVSSEATTSTAGRTVAPAANGAGGAEVRERRYRCSSCGKKFFQVGHLKKHQFSHTEEKPFSCSQCGKNYTSAESFRAHQVGLRWRPGAQRRLLIHFESLQALQRLSFPQVYYNNLPSHLEY